MLYANRTHKYFFEVISSFIFLVFSMYRLRFIPFLQTTLYGWLQKRRFNLSSIFYSPTSYSVSNMPKRMDYDKITLKDINFFENLLGANNVKTKEIDE